MRKKSTLLLSGVAALASLFLISTLPGSAQSGKIKQSIASQGAYTGSQSCRPCHERFYKLWEPSRHGKAMQAYNRAFANTSLTPQKEPITIQGASYLAQIGPGQGWVVENKNGRKTRLAIKHALGGKNIYYFLTPMEKGRLQTLPLAYDVHNKKWFDTAKSGIRHAGDAQVDWRDASYTFNTSCHGCHVSQYSLNYDLKSGVYRTTWAEPGINCETCHGPGEEHIRVCLQAPKGTAPEDLRIERGGRDFSYDQNNAACSTCHAKAVPLTQRFTPGDLFWDHFDLATLEHPDYYPDGRDLGENYTYTTWIMSPCVKSGKLDCLHCHTSSGRFRQKKDPNKACAPCHEARVKDAQAHTRHQPGPDAPTCLSCHMPMTTFARMKRSDHSMLPPMPAASIRFGSPNACNLCHKDKTPAWADKKVRAFWKSDYQAPYLKRAGMIEAARKRNWSQLGDMLDYLRSKDRDQVFAASLIRLLRHCPKDVKWGAVLKAAEDPSPLVRAAALESLEDLPSAEAGRKLLNALNDSFRLVRIRAAQSLAGYPKNALNTAGRQNLDMATKEMLHSLMARPDTWSAHYNVGNYFMARGRTKEAVYSYEMALKLEPRAVMPMVNLAMAHARAGQLKKAEGLLNRALAEQPHNPAANFNLGLLRAETGDSASAEKHLRIALRGDPKMARAAYNLGLLLRKKSPTESTGFLLKAYELSPSPHYAFTLAYHLNQAGERKGAGKLLALAIREWPWYADSYLLLADIHLAAGEKEKSVQLLKEAIKKEHLSQKDRQRVLHKLSGIKAQN